jgi:hypothetical protein
LTLLTVLGGCGSNHGARAPDGGTDAARTDAPGLDAGKDAARADTSPRDAGPDASHADAPSADVGSDAWSADGPAPDAPPADAGTDVSPADAGTDAPPADAAASDGGAGGASATRALTLLAGAIGGPGSADGVGAAARMIYPWGMTADGQGALYLGDGGKIRKLVLASGDLTTIAGALDTGHADGTGTGARFNGTPGLASSPLGDVLYVADGYVTIRKIEIASGVVTTLAGSPDESGSADGTGGSARFNVPWGIVSVGSGGDLLYVADGSGTIRKIVASTGVVTTLAGSAGTYGTADGVGPAASFESPVAIAGDPSGATLYVVDQGAATIRRIDVATATVATLAGAPNVQEDLDGVGTAAHFDTPAAIALDGAGNLYVADRATIRKVEIATAAVTTLAGSSPTTGSADGVGSAARLSSPQGLASDGQGNLYASDSNNSLVRRIALPRPSPQWRGQRRSRGAPTARARRRASSSRST